MDFVRRLFVLAIIYQRSRAAVFGQWSPLEFPDDNGIIITLSLSRDAQDIEMFVEFLFAPFQAFVVDRYHQTLRICY